MKPGAEERIDDDSRSVRSAGYFRARYRGKNLERGIALCDRVRRLRGAGLSDPDRIPSAGEEPGYYPTITTIITGSGKYQHTFIQSSAEFSSDCVSGAGASALHQCPRRSSTVDRCLIALCRLFRADHPDGH